MHDGRQDEQYSQDGGLGGHKRYPLEAQEHAADRGAETEAFGWAPNRCGILSAHHHHQHHQCHGHLQDTPGPARNRFAPSATHRPRMTQAQARQLG